MSSALAEVLRDAEAYFNVRDCPSIIKATVAAETAAFAKCSLSKPEEAPVSLGQQQPLEPSEQRSEDKSFAMRTLDETSQDGHKCELERDHVSSKEDSLLRMIPCEPLASISEDSLLADETWKAENPVHATVKLGHLNSDGQQAPEAWMQSWAQQVSELMSYFSREIAALTERVDTMQESMKAFVTEKHLEIKASESRTQCRNLGSEMQEQITAAIRHEASLREEQIIAAVRHEASLREDLSKLFSDALGMERDNRMSDVSKLHRSLQALSFTGSRTTPGASCAGSQVNSEVPGMKVDSRQVPDVVGAEWKAVAADLSELRTRLAEEVNQSQSSAGDLRDLSACAAALKSRVNVALQSKPSALDWGPQIYVSPNASKTDSSEPRNSTREAEGNGIEGARAPTIVRRLDAESRRHDVNVIRKGGEE